MTSSEVGREIMSYLRARWAMLPALLIAGTIASGDASAQSGDRRVIPTRDFLACYRFDSFDEVYKLNIKPHSRLSESREEREFDHPRQFVFSVHGKHVGTCGFGTVRPVVGTLITTLPVGRPGGARLGLESLSTTGVPNFCRDFEISCKSAGRGFPPRTWECFGQNKFDIEFQFTLERVVEHEDDSCSQFEDGARSFFDEEPPSDDGEGTGMSGEPPS
jgi:hypothetical protein